MDGGGQLVCAVTDAMVPGKAALALCRGAWFDVTDEEERPARALKQGFLGVEFVAI